MHFLQQGYRKYIDKQYDRIHIDTSKIDGNGDYMHCVYFTWNKE